MKNEYQYIDCSGMLFNEIEFKALRNEQQMRVEMAYNHGHILAGIILVFWAAIFAFCKDLYDIASAADSVIGKSALIDSLIACGITVFCGIPTLIIYPFSVKYHDNIRQIVSIATYIRVFYEYPSFIKEKNEAEENKDKPKVNGWELIHCSHNIPRGNFLAIEFYVISIASIILSTLLWAALFACIFGINHNYIEGCFSNTINSFFLLISFIYLIFLCIIAKYCYKNVKIEKLFETYGEIYFDKYLQEAQDLKFLNEQEIEGLKEYMKKMNIRDTLIKEELHKRKI